MFVEIKNLIKLFGNLVAVNNLTFGFDSSQIYGFVGPNGAGKTTTMRILATLDTPDSGDALIGGYSSIAHPEEVRELIGFMPDYYNTYPHMVVWEYLDFFARCYGFKRKDRKQRVAGVMDFTDLIKLKDKTVDSLSKGMKQRLCLGRALIHDPKVLILDEPAAGLDPRARIELRELLKVLKDEGRAILISSHILTELSEICDGVAIIEKGGMVTSGNISDIQAKMNGAGGKDRDRKTVELRVASQREACERFLLEQMEVGEVREKGQFLCFSFEGGEDEQVSLLKRLVEKDFPVLEFKLHTESLEDIFMKLTKGEIQ